MTSFPLKRIAAIFAFSTLALASSAVHATSLVKYDEVDLSHIAELVVVGEVQSVKMQAEPTAPTIASPTIRTHNAVKIIETWKGDEKPGDIVDVVEAGGIVDGKGFNVISSPGYKVGERVVLFLEHKTVTPGWLTIAYWEGKYTLIPNEKGGFDLAQHLWTLDERGQRFDRAGVPKSAMKQDIDLPRLAAIVKKTVEGDRKAGVRGRDLPKYAGQVTE